MREEIILSIEQACEIEYGTRVVRKRDAGKGYPVYGGGGATFEMDEFNREDRIVIARFGMSEKCTRFVTDKFFLNDSGLTLSPKEISLSQRFLDFQILSLNDKIYAMGKGTAQKNLDVSTFRKLEIFVPPLPEQERIVSILDKAFEGIDKAIAQTEQNLASARELLESYLNNIFTQKGGDWVEKKLGDVCDFSAGFAFKSSGYTKADDGVKLLRGDNIIQGRLRWEGVKKWPTGESDDYAKFALEENDVVLAMDRPWVSDGLKIAHITSDDLPVLQVQRTARLRCLATSMWKYVYHLLRSRHFISYILSGQTGLGVPHISGKQILSYTFHEPQLATQASLVKKLDHASSPCKQLEALYTQKLNDLKELKQSLLQQAFAGELTKEDAAWTKPIHAPN